MNDTPNWDKWCKIVTELSRTTEAMDKHQRKIINAIQEDMNKPGKDHTESILEAQTDLTTLKTLLQPLLKTIEEEINGQAL